MDKELAIDYSRKITQSTPTQLVVITYELMIHNLVEAIEKKEEDVILYRYHLNRTRDLLSELIRALDLKYAISGQLLQLYLFFNRSLMMADFRNDASELPRIQKMLTNLMNAFKDISIEDQSGPVMENTQQVYAGLTYSKGSLNEDLTGDLNRGYKV